jgi:hypothetical protein
MWDIAIISNEKINCSVSEVEVCLKIAKRWHVKINYAGCVVLHCVLTILKAGNCVTAIYFNFF